MLCQRVFGSHHFEATEWPPIQGPKYPRRINVHSYDGFCIDMMNMVIGFILLGNKWEERLYNVLQKFFC
jgi:hypothetical protein